MSDKPSSDKLPHHNRQVGSDGSHTVFQVVVQLHAVLCDLDHLEVEKKKYTERKNVAVNQCNPPMTIPGVGSTKNVVRPLRRDSDLIPTLFVSGEYFL